jgi:pimeloyl-ACP methyl ester carboxylesterase
MPDGARIACYAYGRVSDTCVLILHGNGEEHGIFGPTIDHLVEGGHMVVALDSRAQGKSTRGTAHLTYELMAEDAVHVLDALKVGRAHAVGFSDGGIECLILARDWPDRIASIVAIGANITPEGVLEEPDWDIEGTMRENLDWATYWTDPGTACEQRPEDVDRTLLEPSPEVAFNTFELMRLMLEEPHISAESLDSISCETGVVCGEWDAISEYETALIARSIPGARLVVVDEAYHSLPKHECDVVTRIVEETIGRAS